MKELLQIISLSCLTILIVNFVTSPLIRGIFKRNIKPFSCAFCMSWWVGLITFTYIYGYWGAAYAAMTAVITSYIDTRVI